LEFAFTRRNFHEGAPVKVAVVKETQPGERRVALVPESCRKLVVAGYAVGIEAGAGAAAFFADDAYRRSGAAVADDAGDLFRSADLVPKVVGELVKQLSEAAAAH
jgi:NAD(P) transhydrogenase subunit alpha